MAVCPETVIEVVFFYRAQPGDGAITAVMVGDEQAVRRNDLAGAAKGKQNHRIFPAGLVDAVQ